MAADNEPAQPKPEKAASSAGNAPAGTEELKTSRNITNNAKSANNDNNNNAASNSKNIADNDSVSSSYDSGSNADTPTAKAATIPASTPTPTNANLIVNYLPNSLSDAEFLGIFEKIGPVLSAKIMRNKMTGYSYGYGFVAFADAADAAAAIRSLDGAQLQHKRLKVAYCRRGGGRSGGDNNSSGGDEIKNANLFIANLPLNFTEDELERVFGASGEIVRSKILVDHATGVSKGCGFVLFSKTAEADEAVAKLNGRILDLPGFCFTHPLVVKKAKDENRPNAAAAAATAAAHYGGGGGYSAAYRSTPVHVIHHHYNAAAAAKDKEGVEGGTDGELVPRFKTYDAGAAAAAGVSAAPASSSSPPGHALYVYGIGSLATELDLYALFAPFGAIVKVFVVREAATRAGKGFGFVTFGDYRDACLAVQTLNGYPFHKNSMRPLQVSFKTQRSLSSSSSSTVTAGASETAKVGHHYPPHHPPHSPQ